MPVSKLCICVDIITFDTECVEQYALQFNGIDTAVELPQNFDGPEISVVARIYSDNSNSESNVIFANRFVFSFHLSLMWIREGCSSSNGFALSINSNSTDDRF